MPDLRLGESLFFDKGIDRIVLKQGQSDPSLPDLRRLVPSEHAEGSHLDQILFAPSFESTLDALVRPQVNDRELLFPPAFQQALRGALASLQQHRDALKDPRSREHKVLQRAIRLLSEDGELRDLVRMYFSALYQG